MVQVTLVSMADCLNCGAVKETLEELQKTYPDLVIETVDALSPAGEELIIRHGIMASPGVLINDKLISTGAVSSAQLEKAVSQAVS